MRITPTVIFLLLILDSHWVMGERLTLDQAYALAIKNHPSIRILHERVAQADAAYYRSWSAIKPVLAFQGTFTHFDQEIAINMPMSSAPIVMQKQEQFGFSTSAQLPLFNGPAYPKIGLAKNRLEVARLTEIRSQRDFLLRVAQAYYQVVSGKEAIKSLEHKLEVSQTNLSAAKTQFQVGKAARGAVMRAELVTTQDAQNLLAQRIALQAASKQLGILIGVPGPVEVERPAEPAELHGSSSTMFKDALRLRPDFKAIQLSLDMARQTRKAIWWSFAPTLDLTGLYRWSEAAGFAPDKDSWNILLTLNVPLYDAGLRYADLRESSSRIREAKEQVRAFNQEVESELVQLRAQLETAETAVHSARQAVELATVTESDMQISFTMGAASQLDVLDASQRLLEAQLQLTASLYNRDLSRLSLAHAMGKFDPLRRQP